MPHARIVDAALALVDEVGVSEFSMRALADRLGSGTATLYRRLGGKDEILTYVADRVLGEVAARIQTREPRPTWDTAIIVGAESLFEVLRSHPKAVVLFLGPVPAGPNALRAREHALRTLLAAGLSPHVAAQTYTTVARYVIGFGLQLSEEALTSQAIDDDLSALYRSLDPQRFPATLSAADSLPRPLTDEFHFGLQLILRGVRALRSEA
ncbi:MAG TPA: TetR/AcrR family transcriptional regulator [Pseudonocardia sp.]|jgi:AcrR family transcriptional regulator